MVEVDEESCKSCRFCIDVSRCMSPSQCIGCLSCYWSCPYNARKIKFLELEEKNVSIWVEDRVYLVPYPSTLKEALENIGIAFGKNGSRNLSSPCNLGGCWACSVIVDGKLERTCITPVREGMKIKLDVENIDPLRIVHARSLIRLAERELHGGKFVQATSRQLYGLLDVILDARNARIIT
ncbi:MAG: 2Fe-2S iron-sulfur cluster-binding protein [Nitrososphaerota archaeon]